MSQLEGDEARAKLAATLMLTSPGVPFIYYGEEIGMTGVKPDEDIRLPMKWSDKTGFGFTSGSPWRCPIERPTRMECAHHDGRSWLIAQPLPQSDPAA